MQELLAGAGHGDLAGLEHVTACGDGKRHLRVLLDQKHRGAGLVQVLDNLEDLFDQNRCREL